MRGETEMGASDAEIVQVFAEARRVEPEGEAFQWARVAAARLELPAPRVVDAVKRALGCAPARVGDAELAAYLENGRDARAEQTARRGPPTAEEEAALDVPTPRPRCERCGGYALRDFRGRFMAVRVCDSDGPDGTVCAHVEVLYGNVDETMVACYRLIGTSGKDWRKRRLLDKQAADYWARQNAKAATVARRRRRPKKKGTADERG